MLEQCIERLTVEPDSLWRAKALGGEKWFGWSLTTSMLADLLDGQQFQTSATAVNKKARLKNPTERPDPKKAVAEHRPATVADMRWGDALASLR